MNEIKIKKKNLWMFPLGTVGRDMVYNLVTNFLLTYILFTKGLNAAQLGSITAIMVGARVFDALNDPIMGNIIESTHTKWGKFKPWLAIGILLTSIIVVWVFSTPATGWKFVWIFGVFYIIYSIAYTMHDISYWGMVPALGSDAQSRDQYTSRATLFAGIGGTLASIVIPMVTTGNGTIGGSATFAYKVVAIVICILAPLFLCFTLFGAKEKRQETKKKSTIGLKRILYTLKNNDQLCWMAIIFLIQQIGNGLVIGGVGSTYIYFKYGYEGGLYSLFTTVGMSATALLMVFYPTISKKIKRKSLMNIMAVISVVGYVLMLLSHVITPVGFILLVVGYMLSNFGQYCYYLVMMISIINTVEYNEYKTKERDEAIIASVRPFITKMASAFIVMITTGSYMLFNVTNYTNRISNLESASASGLLAETDKLLAIKDVLTGVLPMQSLGLMLVMTILPCALMLISNYLYQKNYKLDEDEYSRICQELNK